MRTFAIAALVGAAAAANQQCPVECVSYDKNGSVITSKAQPFGHIVVTHHTLHSTGAHGPSQADASCKFAVGGCTPSVIKPHTCRHNVDTNMCTCACLGDTEATVVATKAPTKKVGEIATHFSVDTKMTLAGITVATFTESAQLGVRIAVAKAAGVHRENVRIAGIKAGGRRLAEAAASVSFDIIIDVFSTTMLKTVQAEVKAVVEDSHTADDFTALISKSMAETAKAAGATPAVVDALEAATAIATTTQTTDVSVIAVGAMGCNDFNGWKSKCNLSGWHSSIFGNGLRKGCQFHVATGGGTCKAFCANQGSKCVRAQDNSHTGVGAHTCSLDGAHTRQSTADSGCNQKWNDQICVCDEKLLLPTSCNAFTNFKAKCDLQGWHKSITNEGLRDGCQFHVATGGGTCKSYCAKQGSECIRAQDNKGGCDLDANHGRQSTAGNGCNQHWGDQICVCGKK